MRRRSFSNIKRIGCITLIVLVVLGGLVMAFTVFKSCGIITVKPAIERTLPDNLNLLYEVRTTSRIYYAEKCAETEENVGITNYWEFTDKKWQYRQETFVMPIEIYGKIAVKSPSPSPK